ncbi:hypothetical protein ACU60T_25250 [Klebsiella aerogenes]
MSALQPQQGRIDSFIIKDILLVDIGLTLLRHDLHRVVVSRRLAGPGHNHTQPQASTVHRTGVASLG